MEETSSLLERYSISKQEQEQIKDITNQYHKSLEKYHSIDGCKLM